MGDGVQVPAGGGDEAEGGPVVWVPHNLYRLRDGRLVAMDSSLWRLVEPERRALLVRPLEGLSREPGPCRAPARVSHDEQLRDLRAIARPRMPGIARRLLEVTLLPFRVRVDPVEGLQSARLASAILELDPEPAGGAAWLPLALREPPRPYGWLMEREARLRAELALLASRCEPQG